MTFNEDTQRRYGFHPGTQDTIPMHEASSMWANKAVAELAPVDPIV